MNDLSVVADFGAAAERWLPVKVQLREPLVDVPMDGHTSLHVTVLDLSHPVTVRADGVPIVVGVEIDRLDLATGDYTVAIGAHAPEFVHAYDYVWNAASFTVSGSVAASSYVPPHHWRAD